MLVGSVSFRLLEHQAKARGDGEAKEDEEAAVSEEEPESIFVPVHGLGTVSVISAPVSARRDKEGALPLSCEKIATYSCV